MEQSASAKPAPDDPAETEAAISQILAQIGELRALMEQDQAEIERMKAASEILKADICDLRVETRALLDSLKTAF